MRLRDILQRREAIRVELQGIMTKHPAGDLPDDLAERSTTLEREAEQLNAAERRQVLIDDMDRRAQGQPLDGSGGRDSFEVEAAKVTLLDTLRAQTGATDAGATRAREVSAEISKRSGKQPEGVWFSMAHSGVRKPVEKRVFTTGVPTPGGGALIATDVGPVILRLREQTIVAALGAQIMTGLSGNVNLPRLTSGPVAFWVPESTAITETDATMDSVQLRPSHVGAITEISRQLLLQSSADVSALLENDMMQTLAIAIDEAAINGTGTGGQPAGIMTPGSGVTITNLLRVPTWNDLMAAITAVSVANALQGSLGWALNSATVGKLRTTLRTPADTASTFLMDAPDSLCGYRALQSQVMPGTISTSAVSGMSAAVFGNWQMLVIGFFGDAAADVLLNPYSDTAYARGGVKIRAMSTCSIGIRQPKAFSVLNDIVTT